MNFDIASTEPTNNIDEFVERVNQLISLGYVELGYPVKHLQVNPVSGEQVILYTQKMKRNKTQHDT